MEVHDLMELFDEWSSKTDNTLAELVYFGYLWTVKDNNDWAIFQGSTKELIEFLKQ